MTFLMRNMYCLHRKGGTNASEPLTGVCSQEFSGWVLSLQQARCLVGGCVVCLDIAEVIINSSICFDLLEFAAVNVLIEAYIAPSVAILRLISE